jgi:8-oxo-dGTP pyrophosphatase MutT (NUDIX family)
VLLLRDTPVHQQDDAAPPAAAPLQVLMVERHLDSDAWGGALVFPGGKVDPADRELDPARWTGPVLWRWRERLGVVSDADALGLLTTAVRECFEEVGVLLARREDGTELDAEDVAAPTFQEARRRLSDRGTSWDWRPWLADQALTLSFDALAPWSWWLTPRGQRRRFDTRFLVALLPPGQVARHDRVETTSLRWTAPHDALAAHEHGDARVMFPTRHNLRALAAHRHAEEAWQAARDASEPLRRIEPTVVEVDGRTLVQHPEGGPPEPV